MKCPKCNAENYYVGITTEACENQECEMYVKPKGPVSSREGADGTTVWDEGQSEYRPASGAQADVSPNASQGVVRPKLDLDKVEITTLPTKPMTPSTTLKEVHAVLTLGEKSQFQSLGDSLRTTCDFLAKEGGWLARATSPSTAHYTNSSLLDIDDALYGLRAMQTKLGETLEQYDQFLRILQSEDRHSSGSHKSEDTCQMDTLRCRACASSLPTFDLTDLDLAKQKASGCCSQGCLAAIASRNQHQSCETQPREPWEEYADCTYSSSRQGFDTGLSLYLGHEPAYSHGWEFDYLFLKGSFCPIVANTTLLDAVQMLSRRQILRGGCGKDFSGKRS